jgi:hypothetical protein
MCESDYPHADTTWPHSVDIARKSLQGLSDATQYKLLRANAEKLFRFRAAEPPPGFPL